MSGNSTQSERTLTARLAANTRWSRTADPSAATAPARRALLDKFEREVDPDGVLPAADRTRRAEHARKAYYTRLALKSAQARRKVRELTAEADAAEAELTDPETAA
jgi:hypothetical protein